MIIPKEKDQEIDAAQKQIKEVEKQHRKGIITSGERYNKIVDIWTHATDQISNVMFKTLEQNQGKKEFNPVYLMVDSGARGNRQQVRQLAGVRGLMAKPCGDIIEKPILSNFREGLTVLEYFISTHGARKGLADTALKTADSGYMTRKLVDVSQDVIIREDDCGTTNGIWVQAIYEGEDEVVKLSERIVGRCACEDIVNPTNPKEFLDPRERGIRRSHGQGASTAAGVEKVKIRSVLTCESKQGVCSAVLRPQSGHRAARSSSAKRSASSPRNPSANPARSSRCARSTSAARRPACSSSRRSRPRTTAWSSYNELAPRHARGRQQHRPEQERLGLHSGRGRPRAGKPHHRHRRGHLRRRRRPGEEGRDFRAVGSVQRPDSLREGRAR